VNQPEKMYGSKDGAGYLDGRVRYGNAVYEYGPNFADGSYKEAVVDEGANDVTFEFNSPHVIGCTPPNGKPWGIYDAGGREGLVVSGAPCPVEVSTNHGATWHAVPPTFAGRDLDLTDHVKGRRHYWLRFAANASKLRGSKLSWRTICQANGAMMPRLRDGKNKVTFAAGGQGVFSVGPEKEQVDRHVVDGKLDTPKVTLELAAPRGQKAVRLYAAAWQASGAPPDPDVLYHIDYSADGGKTWSPVVKDWRIVRRPPEPANFWSQSFCWGDVALPGVTGPVRVRFHNTRGKAYRTVEAHLLYEVPTIAPVDVVFDWEGEGGVVRTASKRYAAKPGATDNSWMFDAGNVARTRRVSFRPAAE
jgi:hypothetical protein